LWTDPNWGRETQLRRQSCPLPRCQLRYPGSLAFYGNGQTQYNGPVDARQRILCDNIKAAGIVIYTRHVNTDNDPTSAVLQYCAGGADKFSTVTSATQIMAAFKQPRSSLSTLRVAR
jgi:hypothetical protein